MMLDRKQVLPNGYFKTPSKKIDFEKFNLRVPVEVEDLVPYDKEQGLIASISSFGFGGKKRSLCQGPDFCLLTILITGSCGHTVLRGHEPRPTLPDTETLKDGPYLFALGTFRGECLPSDTSIEIVFS